MNIDDYFTENVLKSDKFKKINKYLTQEEKNILEDILYLAYSAGIDFGDLSRSLTSDH